MKAMDFFMETDVVGSKGKRIEQIGQDIQGVVKNYNRTVEDMLSNAIIGESQHKLAKIDELLKPGMEKHGRSTENIGFAVGKAAVNTANMDKDVANSINLEA